MSKTKNEALVNFGSRLAELRKAAGYTQVELAEELGISRRIIAYYEAEADYPPSHLLPEIAKALKITTDELLGHVPIKKQPKPRNTRLQRRLEQIERLDQKTKRQVLQLIDTIIEGEKFKKKASG
jgi:transcriptional regulator with XRE-family HTH domain